MANGNNKRLKAFVRFDGSGRVVAGSLILRKNKPKVGKWQEISAYECCNPGVLPANCIEFVVDTTDSTAFRFTFTTLGIINFTIDWGDGTTHPDSGAGGFYEETHEYPEADTEYTVRICFDNIASVIELDISENL
jgi:hypothetical protein